MTRRQVAFCEDKDFVPCGRAGGSPPRLAVMALDLYRQNLPTCVQQKPHADEVVIDAIDEDSTPLASLDLEPQFAIEPQGANIVVPDRKFHAAEAEPVRRLKRHEHEFLAQAASTILAQQPNPQYA